MLKRIVANTGRLGDFVTCLQSQLILVIIIIIILIKSPKRSLETYCFYSGFSDFFDNELVRPVSPRWFFGSKPYLVYELFMLWRCAQNFRIFQDGRQFQNGRQKSANFWKCWPILINIGFWAKHDAPSSMEKTKNCYLV